MSSSRREFLQFLGLSGLTLTTLGATSLLSSCTHKNALSSSGIGWTPLSPSLKDDLLLADGLSYKVLAQWGDVIGGTKENPLEYGTHNDFTSFIPFDAANPLEGYLLVNHEYINPLFVSGHTREQGPKTKAQVDTEMKTVGASLLHIKKTDGQWSIVKDSKHNFRFDANTAIPLIAEHAIASSFMAYGTMANCAGGKTPWNTFLTCEENYDLFWGEVDFTPDAKNPKKPLPNPTRKLPKKNYGWTKFYDRSPLHYGWVVEINPVTKEAKKLTGLGRFAHECATCVVAKDGRTVVYTGDDSNDEFIYKFISEKPGSLEKGTLYVADTVNGKWLPLTMRSHPDFKWRFKNQTDLLAQVRVAARMLGATPQDRPEDFEINPANGDIIIACTNNKKQNRPHGALLKIVEKNGDYLSLDFAASTFIAGGDESGLSSPDNMAFDKAGNLWVTTDRSEDEIDKPHYAKFKNNGLYYIPMKGPHAGQCFQVASAPVDAELTGPTFSPDGETLFLCIQHPGDRTEKLGEFTSNWPRGKGEMPRSSLVTIQGDLLKKLTN